LSNTRVTDKILEKPYFSMVGIIKTIIQEQKSIPQIQGIPWICGIFLFVRFYEFLSVSNKLETN